MRYLIVFLFTALTTLVAYRYAPDTRLTGIVRNEAGQPVSGAIVEIKGTTISAVTGQDGKFTLDCPGICGELVITAAGYEQRLVPSGQTKFIQVRLKPLPNELREPGVKGRSAEQHAKAQGTQPGSGSPVYQPRNRAAGSAPLYEQDGTASSADYPGLPDDRLTVHNREGYAPITENRFLKTTENPLSTFSIDVDAASYSNIRRFINSGRFPPHGAVRIEEMINYFRYDYARPEAGQPFAVHSEIAECPWKKGHQLLLVGLQGKTIPVENLPPANLVFLVDVSGSMQEPGKLPLVKASMKMLADQLRPKDRVSIAVYAGSAGLVLAAAGGNEKEKIKKAIDQLQAGGSTAGGEGIRLAYAIAKANFVKGGNNRVILCTDGDFNVGVSSDDELVRLIEAERKTGVFLTVLGFGTGNYQDAKMQLLADRGNGNHAYIDHLGEARKVLVREFGGTLFAIAQDVKLQVEFNPKKVQGYRLIGYENRLLQKEDFNDDRKDAGELGSGHTVTALYELIPAGVETDLLQPVDPLKYQQAARPNSRVSGEILTTKLRYKDPGADSSQLMQSVVSGSPASWRNASVNLRFAAAVAGYGMLLRQSVFSGNLDYKTVAAMAKQSIGADTEGYRREFISLVEQTAALGDTGLLPERKQE